MTVKEEMSVEEEIEVEAAAQTLETPETPEEADLADPAAPAAFLPFESQEQALEALEQVGYAQAEQAPKFASSALVEAVNALIGADGIVLMDMTSTLPETKEAAYQALSVAAFNAEAAARKDANAAFLLMRTQSNTPSFLFGHHWNLVQSLGSGVADQHVRNQPTPAAFVMFRERQLVIPSSVCAVDETLAARLLAAEITEDKKHFCCEICGEALVKHDAGGNIVEIAEVACTPDRRIFKRACAEAHNASVLSQGLSEVALEA